jgi:hypothetical protein
MFMKLHYKRWRLALGLGVLYAIYHATLPIYTPGTYPLFAFTRWS